MITSYKVIFYTEIRFDLRGLIIINVCFCYIANIYMTFKTKLHNKNLIKK